MLPSWCLLGINLMDCESIQESLFPASSPLKEKLAWIRTQCDKRQYFWSCMTSKMAQALKEFTFIPCKSAYIWLAQQICNILIHNIYSKKKKGPKKPTTQETARIYSLLPPLEINIDRTDVGREEGLTLKRTSLLV